MQAMVLGRHTKSVLEKDRERRELIESVLRNCLYRGDVLFSARRDRDGRAGTFQIPRNRSSRERFPRGKFQKLPDYLFGIRRSAGAVEEQAFGGSTDSRDVAGKTVPGCLRELVFAVRVDGRARLVAEALSGACGSADDGRVAGGAESNSGGPQYGWMGNDERGA